MVNYPPHSCAGSARSEVIAHGSRWLWNESSSARTDPISPAHRNDGAMSSALNGRNLAEPTRLTLVSELGGGLDGGWWPYTSSVAQELPGLIEALEQPLGHIVDIGVNWSTLDGVPDLDSLAHRGNAALPGRNTRPQRVMTVTGSRAHARLLVVPCRTSTALAVMLLRRAARLPILSVHRDTEAFRIADDIVCAARAEHPTYARPAPGSP